MNIKDIKEQKYIMFEAISGSRAYNLAIDTPEYSSDTDIRGVFKVPNEMHMSLFDPPEEVADDKQDVKYYELRKFFKLIQDGNPNILEMAFLPKECIKKCTPEMEMIIANRNLFISQKAYFTHSGYAYAQWEKCRGQNKLVNNPCPKDPPKKEDFCRIIPLPLWENYSPRKCGFRSDMSNIETIYDLDMIKFIMNTPCRPIEYCRLSKVYDLSKFHVAALEHIPNTYRLYYYGDSSKGVFRGDQMLVCESIPLDDERDRFVGLLQYSEAEFEKAHKVWKNYWDWVKNRNEARWIIQEKGVVDYDCKNMMHCMRLLYSGKNILTKSEPIVRFEGKQREFLMDIRRGKYDYQTLIKIVEEEMEGLKRLKETTKIPHTVNHKAINQLYLEIIKK